MDRTVHQLQVVLRDVEPVWRRMAVGSNVTRDYRLGEVPPDPGRRMRWGLDPARFDPPSVNRVFGSAG